MSGPTIRTALRGLATAAWLSLLCVAGPSSASAQDAPPAEAPPADAMPGPPDAQVAPPQGPAAPGAESQQGAPQKQSEQATAPDTAEQRTKLLEELYVRLAASPSPEDAEPIAASIERIWHFSGSATADLLVDRAIAANQAGDQDLAMKLLDAAVLLQPDYAAAWNRRAYLYFMKNDYNRALGDLRRVLALEPNHFRALEGLGQILRNIGEKKAALEAYRKLLAVHPQAAGAKQAVEELKLEVEGQGI